MGVSAPLTSWQVAETVLFDPQERGNLLAFARSRYGIQPEDAEDLVQETAVELLRNQSTVQRPRGLVYAIFRVRCARFLSLGRPSAFAGCTPGLEALPDPRPSEAIDRQLALRQALGVISSVCRRILAAYYIEGRSLDEAARSVDHAASGVSRTLNRCLKRLRACLN